MNVPSIIKTVERYVINNSPTILTGVGVAGTLATAYLTGKATFKAADILAEDQINRNMLEIEQPERTLQDKVKLVWMCYIPPALSVATTVGCIVVANSISGSRLTALAAAYAISDKNFSEYKDKVKEVVGVKKSEDIQTAVAQDIVDANPPSAHGVLRGHGGDTLCLDKWTGRYFTSDMQTIRATENDMAKGLYKGNDVVTLSDFYEALGLPIPDCADAVGWNNDAPIDLTFDTALSEGKPVLVMNFATQPFPVLGYFGRN